jgi:hypothetical protein
VCCRSTGSAAAIARSGSAERLEIDRAAAGGIAVRSCDSHTEFKDDYYAWDDSD